MLESSKQKVSVLQNEKQFPIKVWSLLAKHFQFKLCLLALFSAISHGLHQDKFIFIYRYSSDD